MSRTEDYIEKQNTVCKFCGEKRYAGATIGCADCWEIAHRLSKPIKVLRKIFAAERPDLEIIVKEKTDV